MFRWAISNIAVLISSVRKITIHPPLMVCLWNNFDKTFNFGADLDPGILLDDFLLSLYIFCVYFCVCVKNNTPISMNDRLLISKFFLDPDKDPNLTVYKKIICLSKKIKISSLWPGGWACEISQLVSIRLHSVCCICLYLSFPSL